MEMETTQTYSPHLKKVLRSFQTAAMKSLSGPSSYIQRPEQLKLGMDTEQTIKKEPISTVVTSVCSTPNTDTISKDHEKFSVSECDVFLTPPPFPVQQLPILTASDQSRSEREETALEGENISCFLVGGEKRLCLPQILNSVLRDFSLSQINQVCDELQIFCSRCNHEQLEVLKATGILPLSAPSCGLITKTDAERLCSALLHKNPPKSQDPYPNKRQFSMKVYHECFGKCKGICAPDRYTSVNARCIECVECRGLFSPPKFVCHAHKALENRTCHWGFDSANWRAYLLLAKDQEDYDKLVNILDEFKSRFDHPKYKRKQSGQAISKEESGKKTKYEDSSGYSTLMYGDPYMYWLMPWSKVPASAFRPWSPLVTKDGRPLPPPSFIRDYPPQAVPTYLSQGPPVLLNPERVVPLSESERFERHYQPNVALAPPSHQLKIKQEAGTKAEQTKESTPCSVVQCKLVSAEEPAPSRALQTNHSPTAKQSGQPSYNPEIELSSDSEDSSSDAAAEAGGDSTKLKENLENNDFAVVRKALDGVTESTREQVLEALKRLQERMNSAESSRDRAMFELQELRRQQGEQERHLKDATTTTLQLKQELETAHLKPMKDGKLLQRKVMGMEHEIRILQNELACLRDQKPRERSPVSVITASPAIKCEMPSSLTSPVLKCEPSTSLAASPVIKCEPTASVMSPVIKCEPTAVD